MIIYNNKKIIPAPLVSIDKTYDRTDDGTILGSTFNIVVTGKLVAWAGSPNSTGVFHTISGYPANEVIEYESRLQSILKKQAALRDLFSEDGLAFEIQSLDGSQATKFYPRILSISFAEGLWYNTCDYTIVMEADYLLPEREDSEYTNIKSASENWSIETDEGNPESIEHPSTFRLTHTVSAKGKKTFEAGNDFVSAITNAKTYVQSRLGIDSQFVASSGINNLPSYYQGYNHVRSESTDELSGDYNVTETWLLASGNALENFTISTTNSEEGIIRVNINGNITGLTTKGDPLAGPYSNGDQKYQNALNKFHTLSGIFYSRATNYSNVASLGIIPVSTNIGQNPSAGTINYSYDYDNKPNLCITGSKSEVFNITQNGYGDIFASIPVIGRNAGPVLQDIGTVTALNRALSMEIVFGPSIIDCSSLEQVKNTFLLDPLNNPLTSGELYTIIQGVNPGNQGFTQVYNSAPVVTWEPKTGRFSYNINWTYEA